MLSSILSFVLVALVIASIGRVTRSFFATIVGALAFSVLVFATLAVQLGNDVGSILGYASDPKEPVLAVITDSDRTLAAFRVKPQSFRARQEIMAGLQSTDPAVHGKALAEAKRRFAPDLPDDFKGPPPPSVVRAMITDCVESVDGAKLAELTTSAASDGWSTASKGSFRLVRLDVASAKRILTSHPTVVVPVHMGETRYEARLKVPFFVDCIAATDCRERLLAAAHDPTIAIAQVNQSDDVLRALEWSDEKSQAVDQSAEYLPPGGFANGLAAGLVLYMAEQTVAERGPAAFQEALQPQPVELYPKTPIARLLDRVVDLASSGPLAELARRAITGVTKRMNS